MFATAEEHRQAYEKRQAEGAVVLAAVRDALKKQSRSGASVARELGKSASQVNLILRGDWPHLDAQAWPLYFDRWMSRNGLNPEGRLVSYVFVRDDGTRMPDFTLEVTEAEAARRNAERERTGKGGQWVVG